MNSSEIRSRFLGFFEKRGHTIIPSASLVTPDEKNVTNSTLFNTAGMQPLIPYLLGKSYLKDGQEIRRLVNVQKCLRTVDLDDVGDKTHATFFEMLGNWSLGDYFKEEAIRWSYEFLTSTSDKHGDQGLGLDPKRLYITVFAGDANASRDLESAKIWESVGIPKNRIYFKDASANWWPAVKAGKEDNWTGPTGPCSEMFFDITKEGLGDLTTEEFERADADQKVVEIWNDVFMEFEKVNGKIVGKLARKNVDTGAGLERLATVLQGVDNIYDTDLFRSLLDKMTNATQTIQNKRIIADHLRASVFLIADGVMPANTDRGYILRRLIRRAIISMTDHKLDGKRIEVVLDSFEKVYSDSYPELSGKRAEIMKVILDEASKFTSALSSGISEFEHIAKTGLISGVDAFMLFSSFGLPIDVIRELADGKNLTVDVVGFESEFKKHQEVSRSGAKQKFKGGLADVNDPMIIRYHTATHLLHQALHDVLGDGANQRGSNITAERLRFDFSWDSKLTDEQKTKVEEIVNEKINNKLPVNNVILPQEEAKKTDARQFFGEKYGDLISIYFIGQSSSPPTSGDLINAYSKEFCGGPHVKNTSELTGSEGRWRFKIVKEEAVSQGVRRIKAVLV